MSDPIRTEADRGLRESQRIHLRFWKLTECRTQEAKHALEQIDRLADAAGEPGVRAAVALASTAAAQVDAPRKRLTVLQAALHIVSNSVSGAMSGAPGVALALLEDVAAAHPERREAAARALLHEVAPRAGDNGFTRMLDAMAGSGASAEGGLKRAESGVPVGADGFADAIVSIAKSPQAREAALAFVAAEAKRTGDAGTIAHLDRMARWEGLLDNESASRLRESTLHLIAGRSAEDPLALAAQVSAPAALAAAVDEAAPEWSPLLRSVEALGEVDAGRRAVFDAARAKTPRTFAAQARALACVAGSRGRGEALLDLCAQTGRPDAQYVEFLKALVRGGADGREVLGGACDDAPGDDAAYARVLLGLKSGGQGGLDAGLAAIQPSPQTRGSLARLGRWRGIAKRPETVLAATRETLQMIAEGDERLAQRGWMAASVAGSDAPALAADVLAELRAGRPDDPWLSLWRRVEDAGPTAETAGVFRLAILQGLAEKPDEMTKAVVGAMDRLKDEPSRQMIGRATLSQLEAGAKGPHLEWVRGLAAMADVSAQAPAERTATLKAALRHAQAVPSADAAAAALADIVETRKNGVDRLALARAAASSLSSFKGTDARFELLRLLAAHDVSDATDQTQTILIGLRHVQRQPTASLAAFGAALVQGESSRAHASGDQVAIARDVLDALVAQPPEDPRARLLRRVLDCRDVRPDVAVFTVVTGLQILAQPAAAAKGDPLVAFGLAVMQKISTWQQWSTLSHLVVEGLAPAAGDAAWAARVRLLKSIDAMPSGSEASRARVLFTGLGQLAIPVDTPLGSLLKSATAITDGAYHPGERARIAQAALVEAETLARGGDPAIAGFLSAARKCVEMPLSDDPSQAAVARAALVETAGVLSSKTPTLSVCATAANRIAAAGGSLVERRDMLAVMLTALEAMSPTGAPAMVAAVARLDALDPAERHASLLAAIGLLGQGKLDLTPMARALMETQRAAARPAQDGVGMADTVMQALRGGPPEIQGLVEIIARASGAGQELQRVNAVTAGLASMASAPKGDAAVLLCSCLLANAGLTGAQKLAAVGALVEVLPARYAKDPEKERARVQADALARLAVPALYGGSTDVAAQAAGRALGQVKLDGAAAPNEGVAAVVRLAQAAANGLPAVEHAAVARVALAAVEPLVDAQKAEWIRVLRRTADVPVDNPQPFAATLMNEALATAQKDMAGSVALMSDSCRRVAGVVAEPRDQLAVLGVLLEGLARAEARVKSGRAEAIDLLQAARAMPVQSLWDQVAGLHAGLAQLSAKAVPALATLGHVVAQSLVNRQVSRPASDVLAVEIETAQRVAASGDADLAQAAGLLAEVGRTLPQDVALAVINNCAPLLAAAGSRSANVTIKALSSVVQPVRAQVLACLAASAADKTVAARASFVSQALQHGVATADDAKLWPAIQAIFKKGDTEAVGTARMAMLLSAAAGRPTDGTWMSRRALEMVKGGADARRREMLSAMLRAAEAGRHSPTIEQDVLRRALQCVAEDAEGDPGVLAAHAAGLVGAYGVTPAVRPVLDALLEGLEALARVHQDTNYVPVLVADLRARIAKTPSGQEAAAYKAGLGELGRLKGDVYRKAVVTAKPADGKGIENSDDYVVIGGIKVPKKDESD